MQILNNSLNKLKIENLNVLTFSLLLLLLFHK